MKLEMFRRRQRGCMGALLLVLVCTLGSAVAMSKPNVILILVDDLGFNDLGVMGSPDVKSPNIDRLATEGAQFWNTYATAGFCSPSRASLLSGRNPAGFGYVFNPVHTPEDSKMGLPTDITILPETLRREGYDTYMLGKWHLGFSSMQHPLKRGFKDFFGFLGGSFPYFRTIYDHRTYHIREYLYDRFTVPESTRYLTNAFTDKTIDYISQSHNNDKPFFVYLSYNAPHGPYEFRQSDRDPSVSPERQPHVAMIKALDDDVGRLMDHLRGLSILEDTLIIFTNDNGGHHDGASNAPLSMFKGSFHEGGVRVPLFVYWEGKIAGNQNITHPITLMDIYPTFQAAAGVSPGNRNPAIEGTDLMPYIRMRGESRRQESGAPHDFICLASRTQGLVRRGDWKIMTNNGRVTHMYNLRRDIAETTNLVGRYPAREAELRALYSSCDARSVPVLFPEDAQPNPLNVTIARTASTPIRTGMNVRFRSTVTNRSGGTRLKRVWEVFRPQTIHMANYLLIRARSAPLSFSSDRTTATVNFRLSGPWIVRLTIRNGRWTKWADYRVNVSSE